MSTPEKRSFWLVKFAPFRTSWVEVVKRGTFTMRGVRNSQARNHLVSMRLCDPVLFYHSQVERAVVGLCEVTRESFPDPTSADPRWLAVDLRPVETLPRPVRLSQIKQTPRLADIALVRQPRLSVMPLTEDQYDTIAALAASR